MIVAQLMEMPARMIHAVMDAHANSNLELLARRNNPYESALILICFYLEILMMDAVKIAK